MSRPTNPDFALSLSFDGVRLLHRSGDRWTLVGEASPTAEDLVAELAALRGKAQKLSKGALHTRIILPDDQIKFMTLPQADADDAAVHSALDGATPYTLDELVVDHVSRDGKTYVAAVARETLEEAEAFAVEHDFAPVAFAAAPANGAFAGEAFFGPTKAAGSLLGKGQSVNREDHPVSVKGTGTVAEDVGSKVEEPTVEGDAARDEGTASPEAPTAGKRTKAKREAVSVEAEEDEAAGNTSEAEAETSASTDDDASNADDHTAAAGDDASEPVAQPSPDSKEASIADTDLIVADDAATGTTPAKDDGSTDEPVEVSAPEQAPVPPAEPADEVIAEEAPAEDEESKWPEAPASMAQAESAAVEDPSAPAAETTPDPDAETPLFSSRLRAQREASKRAPVIARSEIEDEVPPATADVSKGDAPAFRSRADAPPLPPPASPKVTIDREPRRAPAPAVAPHMPPPVRADGESAQRPQPVPVRLPPGTPPPAVAQRLAAIAGRATPDRSDLPPLSARRDEDPARAGMAPPISTAAAEPAPHPAPDRVEPVQEPDAAPPGKVLRSSEPLGAPPASLAATLRQDEQATRPVSSEPAAKTTKTGGLGGFFSSRRKPDETPDPLPAAKKPAAPKPADAGLGKGRGRRGKGRGKAAAPAAMIETPSQSQIIAQTDPNSARQTERASMTVFGARRREADKGKKAKPRFLLLILLLVLLGFMAAVAALASVYPSSRVAVWLGLSDPPAATAAATPEAASEVSPVAAAIPDAPAVPPDGTVAAAPDGLSETPPVAPGNVAALTLPGAETAPVTGGDVADGPLAPGSLAVPSLPDQGGPDGTPAAQSDPAQPASPAEEVVTAEAAEPDTTVTPAPTTGIIPTPAEADRFYAATGVWLRAPRLPLRPEAEALTDVSVAAITVPETTRTIPDLPALAPDGPLAPQNNPPAADVEFPRDPRGFLLATEEGIVTPDGMAIYARAPSTVPPTRPGTPPPPPEMTEVVDDTGFVNALPEAPARPTLRPASFNDLFGPLPEDSPQETAGAEAVDPDAVTEAAVEDAIDTATQTLPGGVSLAGLRPPLRPEGLAPPEPVEEVLVSFAGPRPPERPGDLAPPEEVAEEELVEEETPIENTVTSALAAIVAAGPDPLATATAQAVARAPRPDTRPRNFATVVANTRARTQAAVAATAPAPAPAAPPAAATEPEAASAAAAAPTGPTNTTVAAAATQASVIDLRSVNLIGVYGRPNDRRALIRLANGRYVRVGIGDALEGGQVTAIGDNALNYVVRGQLYALVIPEE